MPHLRFEDQEYVSGTDVQAGSMYRTYTILINARGGIHMSGFFGGIGCGSPFTSTGAILVLFILLVIVVRSFFF
jgi:hypothetical protein